MQATELVLQYFHRTVEVGITWTDPGVGRTNFLGGCLDSDLAADPDTRLCVSGFVLCINVGHVVWKSTCQLCVTCSSEEAGLVATSICGQGVPLVPLAEF